MRNYKLLLTNRLFIGYSLAIGLAWCDYFAFTLESPFIMQNILGLNSLAFGFVFSLVVLGYLVGTRIAKLYANTIGWDKLIFIASFVSLCGAILMFALTSFFPLHWQLIIFPMMLILVGVGIIIPCTQAAVMQPFPEIAGTASGLFFFIQMLMGTLSGLILQSFSKDSASPMSIIILIASIILFFSFYKLIWQKRSSLLSMS